MANPMIKSSKIMPLSAAIALVFILLLSPRQAPAQQTLITALEWEADSSRPIDYPGRALASPGAWVNVTLFAAPGVEEDPLKTEWFLDEAPVSTPDPFTIRFIATRGPGAEHKVLVRVRDAKTQSTEEAMLFIPVAQPEVLVYGLRKDGQPQPHALNSRIAVKPGESFDVLAKSYFLPGKTALFRWLRNDQAIIGAPKNPDTLSITATLNAIKANQDRITAIAQHPEFPGLTATKEIVVEIR